MSDIINLIDSIKSEPIYLTLVIGMALVIIGCIVPIGTTKAERMGKVQTDPKKKLRIRIGFWMSVAGILVCIAGFVIFGKR